MTASFLVLRSRMARTIRNNSNERRYKLESRGKRFKYNRSKWLKGKSRYCKKFKLICQSASNKKTYGFSKSEDLSRNFRDHTRRSKVQSMIRRYSRWRWLFRGNKRRVYKFRSNNGNRR
eukprot:NODE_48_length_27236_cov_0.507573.p8 type:complete len:119 gc:universal NODE_48_length_27236_cov_0.507573:1226-1582(+)